MEAAKKLKIGMLLTGVIFFFNPCVNLIDVLPDFIGCLFMIAGLYALRDLCGYFGDARRDFLRLFWVSLSKIPAFAIMFAIARNNVTEKATILLFTFVYAVIEGVLLTVAFGNLFDGFIYAGERYGGSSPLVLPLSGIGKRRAARLAGKLAKLEEARFAESGASSSSIKQKKAKLKRRIPREKDSSLLYYLTLFFVIAIKLLNIAPELVHLSTGIEGRPGALNLEAYKSWFILIALAAGLIVGFFWLRSVRRYLENIAADKAFNETLVSQYEIKTAAAPQMLSYRAIKTASVIFIAASALTFDFFLDEFNFIPDIIAATLFLAGAAFIGKRLKAHFSSAVYASAAYIASSALLLAAAIMFTAKYNFSAVGRIDGADTLFIYYAAAQILSEAALIVMLLSLSGAFKKLLKALFANDTVSALTYTNERNAKVYGVYSKKLNRSVAGALVMSAVNVFHLLTLADTGSVAINGGVHTTTQAIYLPVLEGFWMINALVSIIWIIYTARIFAGIAQEYKDKYFLVDD